MDMHFFGTRTDITAWFLSVEAKIPLKYVEYGLFDTFENKEYDAISGIEDLGFCLTGNPVLNVRYLILEKNTDIIVREISQRSGGVKFAIDQLKNPKSLVFSPGGMYEEQYMLFGSLSTTAVHEESRQLFRFVSSNAKHTFKKVKGTKYWLGIDAEALKVSRRFITFNVNQPQSEDLF